jgi:ATP-dependent Clp protease adapter protein ClpS
MCFEGTITAPRPGILEGAVTAGDVFYLDESQYDFLYRIVLHNDDITAMHSVVNILQQVFGFSIMEATNLMEEAHNTGYSILKIENRKEAKLHAEQLHSHGLTVTLEPED